MALTKNIERYPINEISKEEIGKVYQAWGLMN
jgi:hypothetical protein